jgi:hypothetical protein
MLEYKKLTGRDLLNGIEISTTMSTDNLEKVAQLTWVCLLDEDISLKYGDVLHMLDPTNFMMVTEKLTQALTNSLPTKKDDDAPLAGPPSDGAISGPSDVMISDSVKVNSGI